jgi:hypothetical protein
VSDKYYQAWLEEEGLYGGPEIPELSLNRSASELENEGGFLSPIFSRLHEILGFSTREYFHSKIATLLREATEIISAAVEKGRADAYATWLKHELWVPTLDETFSGDQNPGQLFVQALEIIGPLYDSSSAELSAAVSYYCIHKTLDAKSRGDASGSDKLLVEAAVAATTAAYYHGLSFGSQQDRQVMSKRNRAAANARHAFNRANKEKGLKIWLSRDWKPQADAERAIAAAANITQPVAARWIREFKRLRE